MVYPLDLGSSVLDIVGSSPTTPTKIICVERCAGSSPVARTKILALHGGWVAVEVQNAGSQEYPILAA